MERASSFRIFQCFGKSAANTRFISMLRTMRRLRSKSTRVYRGVRRDRILRSSLGKRRQICFFPWCEKINAWSNGGVVSSATKVRFNISKRLRKRRRPSKRQFQTASNNFQRMSGLQDALRRWTRIRPGPRLPSRRGAERFSAHWPVTGAEGAGLQSVEHAQRIFRRTADVEIRRIHMLNDIIWVDDEGGAIGDA